MFATAKKQTVLLASFFRRRLALLPLREHRRLSPLLGPSILFSLHLRPRQARLPRRRSPGRLAQNSRTAPYSNAAPLTPTFPDLPHQDRLIPPDYCVRSSDSIDRERRRSRTVQSSGDALISWRAAPPCDFLACCSSMPLAHVIKN